MKTPQEIEDEARKRSWKRLKGRLDSGETTWDEVCDPGMLDDGEEREKEDE
jgi:hypothetical protein